MPPPAPEGDPRAPAAPPASSGRARRPASSGLETPGGGIVAPPPNSNLRPRPRGRAPAGKTWDPHAACWVAAGEEPEPSEPSFLPKFRGHAQALWLATGRTHADWRRTPLAKRRAFAEAARAEIAIEAGHTGTGDGWDALRGGPRRDGAGGALGRGRRRAICAWLLEEDARIRKRRRFTDNSGWALPLPLALPDAQNGSSRRAWDELLRKGTLFRRAQLAAGLSGENPAPNPALVHAFALRARRALVQAAQWERSNPASHSPSVRGRELGQKTPPRGKKNSSSEDARRSLLFAGFRAGASPAGFIGNLRLGHRRVLEQLLQRFLLARDFARVAEVALVLLSSSTRGVDMGDARAGATWQVYSLYPAAVCGLEAIFRAHPGAAASKFLLQVRSRLHAAAKQFHPTAHVGEYGESLSLRAALAQIGHTGEYTVPRRAFAVHQNREMATELHHTHPERAYVALISHRRLLDAVRDVWRDAPGPPEPPDLLVDLGASGPPRHTLELGWKRLTRSSLAWGGWFSAASATRPELGSLFGDAERDLRHALELDLPRGNGVLLRLLQLHLLAGRVSAAEQLIGELAQGRHGPLSPAALGAVCAWRSARSGRVDVGSLRQLQAVDPAHPGVLSILLGSAIPPNSAADVRDLVEGLCLVLDGDPFHFEAWRRLALVVSAADPSPKDKIQHFVQTPGLHEPRRVKASRLKSLRVVPEEFREDARRALAGALAPRREWWRRFHLRLDSVFSSSAAMPLDAAGSSGGDPKAAGRQFSGAWLRCVNYFESEQLRGFSGSTSRQGLGGPRTGQPPNVGAYADAWSASAAFPFRPEARTLPARELHLQCFWGKDLGPQGGTGKKPAVLLRTREPRGAARPAAVARPRLQPWMLHLKPQTFEL